MSDPETTVRPMTAAEVRELIAKAQTAPSTITTDEALALGRVAQQAIDTFNIIVAQTVEYLRPLVPALVQLAEDWAKYAPKEPPRD